VTVLELSRRQWEALNRADGVMMALELTEAGATPDEVRDAVDRLIRAHERRSG
jgi:hypothetical protein